MPRQKLTAAFVMSPPKPPKGRIVYWDTQQPGFGLRVTSTGHKSYVVQYRAGGGRDGKDRLATIAATLRLDDARREARKIAGEVAKGCDPVQERRDRAEQERAAEQAAQLAAATTVRAVLEDYLAQYCGMTRDAGGNAIFDGRRRSAPEQLRIFEQYVYPDIGEVQIGDLKRSRITEMLDKIARGGPVMADRTLAYFRTALNWYAARTDDFNSPIVRGMARTRPKEREGTRTLDDDEIRDLWTALDQKGKDLPSCFARYIRTLLLTALRRKEASEGVWSEITAVQRDDFTGKVWTIPAGRMKNKRDHAVPLTPALLILLGEQPQSGEIKARPFIFSTTRGRRPFSGFSKAKAALDARIAKLRKEEGRPPMAPWKLHDLRRTAKTLMGRAGVPPFISERVLSHTIDGVAGVYDRYGYLPEKRDALERLATLINRIVNPRANVAELKPSRVAAG